MQQKNTTQIKKIIRLRDKAVTLLFYLSTAMGFYGILVYTPLLVLGSADKIQKILPIHAGWILLIFVPLLLLLGLFFGWFLDRVIGYNRKMAETTNSRNPQITEILETVKRLEVEIIELKKSKK